MFASQRFPSLGGPANAPGITMGTMGGFPSAANGNGGATAQLKVGAGGTGIQIGSGAGIGSGGGSAAGSAFPPPPAISPSLQHPAFEKILAQVDLSKGGVDNINLKRGGGLRGGSVGSSNAARNNNTSNNPNLLGGNAGNNNARNHNGISMAEGRHQAIFTEGGHNNAAGPMGPLTAAPAAHLTKLE
jgi:hypothetical protein